MNLSKNNLVAPYTYYGAKDLTQEIEKYGQVICASIIDTNNVPKPTSIVSNKFVSMVSNMESNKLSVVFLSNLQ